MDYDLRPLKVSVVVVFLFVALYFSSLFFLSAQKIWTNDAFIEGYSVDLSANVTEKIVAIHVDEGDRVVKGQLIAELESNVPLAKKQAAEASIKSAGEKLRVKEAFFEKINNDYVRAVEGIEGQVITRQHYDHSEKDLKIAKAEVQLALAELELAVRNLEVIEAELEHYRIIAPQDGVIAKRWVWLGDVVTPGESLFTMYDLENVWVTANLEEGKLQHVRLGDSVLIHLDTYPEYTFQGNIFTIKGAAASQFSLIPQNNATGNFTKVAQRIPIKITITKPSRFPENMPLYLFPGMSAEVTITP